MMQRFSKTLVFVVLYNLQAIAWLFVYCTPFSGLVGVSVDEPVRPEVCQFQPIPELDLLEYWYGLVLLS